MKARTSLVVGGILLMSAPLVNAMHHEGASMTLKNTSMTLTHMSGMNWEKQPVSAVAKHFGYNWKMDKKKLAVLAGISNYRGSAKQNIMIKKYLLSLSSDAVMVGGEMMVRSMDIVDNALRANNVTTVVAAVKTAGLVETLKSEGPFTVFAPTNSAFEKLPAGTVETLLKPENTSKLTSILTYHVVAGRYKTSDITDGMELATVEGKKLKFNIDAEGKVWINKTAMIETKNVISSNGVTHVIDSVLLPQ